MIYPPEHLLHFLTVSYLRLGSCRTCQGVYRSQAWAARVHRAEALPLLAIQWSNQMRGSCHSLRCRFSIVIYVFNLVPRWFSPTCLIFFIISILKSIRAKRLTLVYMMRTWTNLQSLDRYSWKDRVRKEHVGTVILQICRTYSRPNSCRWNGHFKSWVDRSSQPLDHYSAYVDSLTPDLYFVRTHLIV